jgi:hypothetical protein
VATIPLYDALRKMRQLTELGIPFSFECYTWNATKRHSSGYRVVKKALLRKGLRNDQSDKAQVLIGYVNYDDGVGINRFFYLSILMKFNGLNIIP